MMQLYTYNAKITKVYDADTIRAVLDLGFGISFAGEEGAGHSFRLARINAPEVRGPERAEGLKSRDALRDFLKGKKVLIESLRSSDKYGRYIAELHVKDGDGLICVNDWLVENGLAEYKSYD